MSTNVGGTSDNPATSGNVLSLNLGGVNANFDLGPSTAAVASSAYNFLGTSMSADTALLGNTILGSQAFLNGITQPVLGMAQNEQDFNTTQLPTMFTTLAGQNFTLGTEAVAANEDVAQASIASSNAQASEARSSGGGFCYITSAVCDHLGLPDDCVELQTLRALRDGYMQETHQRRALVAEYYATAPAVCAAIESRIDRASIYEWLYSLYIKPALLCLIHGQKERAFKLYCDMVHTARGIARG